jgi:methyl-accepting chemotaxis protein
VKPIYQRLTGIALMTAGVMGMLLVIAGVIFMVRVGPRVEASATESLELVDRTLLTTEEGLVLAEDSIEQVVETVESLEATVASVGQTIYGTVPLVDSVADLLGERLTETIKATQDTLSSVVKSAKLVDNVLSIVTAIPFIGTDRYQPEVPLHVGLERVATSLDEIPDSLGAAQDDLTSSSGNLDAMQEDFTTMADNIGQIATSLESAQSVLAEYRDIVTDLQEQVSSVRQGLPAGLRWLGIIFTFVLVWLAIAQIGPLIQGWELIQRSRLVDEDTSK